MKKFLIQIVLLLIVIGVGIVFFLPGRESPSVNLPFVPVAPTFKNLKIDDAVIKVEISDTQEKRSKGLGGRESLGESEGMLFIFEKADKYPFWMKGLKFPLDFVWINTNIVVETREAVPPPAPGQADSELPIITSSVEADKVLELNVGAIKKFDIKVGDIINLEDFK